VSANPAPDAVAEPSTVRLTILTPEEILFQGDVSWVEIPLYDGLIGIWPGHAPLIAALAEGTVRYETRGEIRELAVGSGVLRVHEEGCAILVGALQPAADSEGDKEALFSDLEEALHDSDGRAARGAAAGVR